MCFYLLLEETKNWGNGEFFGRATEMVMLMSLVGARSFPGGWFGLWGFPLPGGETGIGERNGDSFAKTCFESSVGEWSAKTGNRGWFLLDFLAFCQLDSCAHNPEVVGSSPASATIRKDF